MPWLTLGSGAMVAQRPLEPLILVRVQAPQLTFLRERELELIINFHTKITTTPKRAWAFIGVLLADWFKMI
jgi:hypothetical protein